MDACNFCDGSGWTEEVVRYVMHQRQTRNHLCHWTGCSKRVPPAMWGCKQHWFALPKRFRDKIWQTYRPGQEIAMTPSAEYITVAHEIRQYIANTLIKRGVGDE